MLLFKYFTSEESAQTSIIKFPAESMVGIIKRSIDLKSSFLENKMNHFLYSYNYTFYDAVPEQKSSPAKIFFKRKFRIPFESFIFMVFFSIDNPFYSMTKGNEYNNLIFTMVLDHHLFAATDYY